MDFNPSIKAYSNFDLLEKNAANTSINVSEFVEELICPVSFELLTQGVLLLPCTHRVQQFVAQRMFGSMLPAGVCEHEGKKCPMCNSITTGYYTDYTVRNISNKVSKSVNLIQNKALTEKDLIALEGKKYLPKLFPTDIEKSNLKTNDLDPKLEKLIVDDLNREYGERLIGVIGGINDLLRIPCMKDLPGRASFSSEARIDPSKMKYSVMRCRDESRTGFIFVKVEDKDKHKQFIFYFITSDRETESVDTQKISAQLSWNHSEFPYFRPEKPACFTKDEGFEILTSLLKGEKVPLNCYRDGRYIENYHVSLV